MSCKRWASTAVWGPMLACSLSAATSAAQDGPPPTLRVGSLREGMRIDGRLDELEWSAADAIDALTQSDPSEGAAPTGRTVVRVLAGAKAIVIGILCEDPDPSGIVTFSVRRDAPLASEDHVRIVLGPFLDGRSGYVFAVNPSGARYDGLIEPGGEADNPDWDGIWEAATTRGPSGWSVEIYIPVHSLSFKPGLTEWHFNVQRRVQRMLETDRWAYPARQYQVTQTSRAGLITGLPPGETAICVATVTGSGCEPVLYKRAVPDQPSAQRDLGGGTPWPREP